MGKGSNATERVTNRRSGPTQPRFFKTSKTHNTMSVSIILREGESIQDAMARAKTNILKQKAATRSDQVLNLSMDELNAMFNPTNAQS